MVKKKRAVKKSKTSFSKEVNKFEKELEKEIVDAEKWVIARKKFLIKLAWVVGLITILLVISNFYLRVRGVGV